MERKDRYQVISAYPEHTVQTVYIGNLPEVEKKFLEHRKRLETIFELLPIDGDYSEHEATKKFINNMTIALVVEKSEES